MMLFAIPLYSIIASRSRLLYPYVAGSLLYTTWQRTHGCHRLHHLMWQPDLPAFLNTMCHHVAKILRTFEAKVELTVLIAGAGRHVLSRGRLGLDQEVSNGVQWKRSGG